MKQHQVYGESFAEKGTETCSDTEWIEEGIDMEENFRNGLYSDHDLPRSPAVSKEGAAKK